MSEPSSKLRPAPGRDVQKKWIVTTGIGYAEDSDRNSASASVSEKTKKDKNAANERSNPLSAWSSIFVLHRLSFSAFSLTLFRGSIPFGKHGEFGETGGGDADSLETLGDDTVGGCEQ